MLNKRILISSSCIPDANLIFRVGTDGKYYGYSKTFGELIKGDALNMVMDKWKIGAGLYYGEGEPYDPNSPNRYTILEFDYVGNDAPGGVPDVIINGKLFTRNPHRWSGSVLGDIFDLQSNVGNVLYFKIEEPK